VLPAGTAMVIVAGKTPAKADACRIANMLTKIMEQARQNI
jgi:glycerol dehydrogenase-like iron-containing ADH family enzyme